MPKIMHLGQLAAYKSLYNIAPNEPAALCPMQAPLLLKRSEFELCFLLCIFQGIVTAHFKSM